MTLKLPLVSVVVPAYNAAPWIGETIETVQAQTYHRWELIIVDDGSTDNTFAVAEEYARRDPRIRLYRLKQNKGYAAHARNVGMKRSRGEMIALLDADDLWVPDKLKKQVAYLLSHPDAGAVCSWYKAFGDPVRAAQWNRMLWRDNSQVITAEQILGQVPATSSIIYRRDVYELIGPMTVHPNLRSGEDREFFMRMALSVPVHRMCEELSLYRVHPVGKSLATASLKPDETRDKLTIKLLKKRGLLKGDMAARLSGQFHYGMAKSALFHLGLPFRGYLWKSLKTGRAPQKAWVMAALCFLPAPILKKTLEALLALRNPKKSEASERVFRKGRGH